MSDKGRAIASPSQTVGPFFHFGLATNDALGRIAPEDRGGARLRLRVRVLDGDGVPVPDALIELYHADAAGAYPATRGPRPFTGFGRLATDADGVCTFETIRPGSVSAGPGAQAPHVTVCLFARGLLRQLYTRIYFAGDPGQNQDPILALVPASRRETLMASRQAESEDLWEFVVRLQGEQETVFFDL